MNTDPIDPHLLLEKLLERQEATKQLRGKVIELLGNPGAQQTAQAMALLYIGDSIQDLTMTLMIPNVKFK